MKGSTVAFSCILVSSDSEAAYLTNDQLLQLLLHLLFLLLIPCHLTLAPVTFTSTQPHDSCPSDRVGVVIFVARKQEVSYHIHGMCSKYSHELWILIPNNVYGINCLGEPSTLRMQPTAMW